MILNQSEKFNPIPKWLFWLPAVILVILSFIIISFDLDRVVSGYFWTEKDGWVHRDNPVFTFLYNFGPLPVFVFVVSIIGLWIYQTVNKDHAAPWRIYIVIILLLAFGPGILVNAIFKNNYGRTRPRSIEAFGGDQKFNQLWVYNPHGNGKSFPSGHASMGFFWIGLIPLAMRLRKMKMALVLLGAGLVHGGLMGLGRIAQGGHFFGDVIWSAGMDYLVGYSLALIFLKPTLSSNTEELEHPIE